MPRNLYSFINYPAGRENATGTNNADLGNFGPQVSVLETSSDYLVLVSSPGFSENDFTINVCEGKLVISASRKNNSACSCGIDQFPVNTWTRIFTLPGNAEYKDMDVSYREGELFVHMPCANVCDIKQ